MMNLENFKASLAESAAPADLSPALAALWTAGKGDWDGAHRIVQDESGADAAWVHAWLHRKEGDDSNAGYWYRRAGKNFYDGSLDREWAEIAEDLLEKLSQPEAGRSSP